MSTKKPPFVMSRPDDVIVVANIDSCEIFDFSSPDKAFFIRGLQLLAGIMSAELRSNKNDYYYPAL